MARAGSSEGLPSEIPDQTVRHRMAGEDLIRYALVALFLVSMVITVALAFGYAYGLTRTLMRCRGLFRIVAMLPLFAPSLVQALAFIYVFGNNGIFTRATGYNVGIYGAKGIVVAEVFYSFPTRAPHPGGRALRHRRAPLR